MKRNWTVVTLEWTQDSKYAGQDSCSKRGAKIFNSYDKKNF
jgi:hypothetical protein